MNKIKIKAPIKFDWDIYSNILGWTTLIALPMSIFGRLISGVDPQKVVMLVLISTAVNYALFAVGILIFSPIVLVKPRVSKLMIFSVSLSYSCLVIFCVAAQYYTFKNTKPDIQNQYLTLMTLIGLRGTMLVAALLFYFNRWMAKSWHELEHRQLAVDVLARDAEIGRLKAQINPHFIFNALTAIVVRSRQPAVDRIVEGLSEVLRYNLAQTHLKDDLGKEIQAITSYLEVIKARFGDGVHIELQADSTATQLHVPQPLLLPLVENAIEHGMKTALWPFHIRVKAEVVENNLIASVENTGTWIEPKAAPAPGHQIGLNNLRRRLELIYGAVATVTHESLPKSVRVTVIVPVLPV